MNFSLAPLLAFASLALLAPAQTSLDYDVSTFAGLPNVGYFDGPAYLARFGVLQGIAVDRQGNVYVVDSTNAAIRKINTAGVVSTLAGGVSSSTLVDGTGTAARFIAPTVLTVDSAGTLYVADKNVGRTHSDTSMVRRITSDGTVTSLVDVLSYYPVYSTFFYATIYSLATDSSGNVYAEANVNGYHGGANNLFQVTPQGVVSRSSIQPGYGYACVGISPSDTFFAFLNYVYFRLERVTTDSNTLIAGGNTTWADTDGVGAAAAFSFVNAMAVGADSTVYLTESFSLCVRKVTVDGLVTTLAGSPGNSGALDGLGTAATFSDLNAVAVDASGNVWVTDSSAVRKITSTGQVTTVAGLPKLSTGGSADGVGTAARLGGIGGLAAGANGTLYVSDAANYTVRKISAAGVVTTLAGSAGLAGSVDGTAADARFIGPDDLAVDTEENLFVLDLDTSGSAVRKITPAGMVTTLTIPNSPISSSDVTGTTYLTTSLAADSAGNLYLGQAGTNKTDYRVLKRTTSGTFSPIDALKTYYTSSCSMTTDALGNLYVVPTAEQVIYKYTPAGTVIDLAIDHLPLTVDRLGNIYLVDSTQCTIYLARPGSASTTLAGGVSGHIDGLGSAARLTVYSPTAVDTDGNLYLSGATTIRKCTPTGLLISQHPSSQSTTAGSNVTLTVSAVGAASLTYQWYFNNQALSGQTSYALTLSNVKTSQAGDYRVVVSNSTGSVTSSSAALSVIGGTTQATDAGSSGGGGAPSFWLLLGLVVLGAVRWHPRCMPDRA